MNASSLLRRLARMRMTPFGRDGLDGVEHEVEKRLAQELFVGLDDHRFDQDFELDFFFLDVVIQSAGDLGGHGVKVRWRRGGLRADASN